MEPLVEEQHCITLYLVELQNSDILESKHVLHPTNLPLLSPPPPQFSIGKMEAMTFALSFYSCTICQGLTERQQGQQAIYLSIIQADRWERGCQHIGRAQADSTLDIFRWNREKFLSETLESCCHSVQTTLSRCTKDLIHCKAASYVKRKGE